MGAIFEETSWVGDFRAKLDSIIFIKIDKIIQKSSAGRNVYIALAPDQL